MSEDSKKENKDFKSTMGMGNSNNKPKFNIFWIYGIIAVVLIALQFMASNSEPKEIQRGEFINDNYGMLKNNDIEKIIVVNKETAEIYLKKEGIESDRYKEIFNSKLNSFSGKGPHFVFNIGDIQSFDNIIKDLKNIASTTRTSSF